MMLTACRRFAVGIRRSRSRAGLVIRSSRRKEALTFSRPIRVRLVTSAATKFMQSFQVLLRMHIATTNCCPARERLGVRQSSAAFECRRPCQSARGLAQSKTLQAFGQAMGNAVCGVMLFVATSVLATAPRLASIGPVGAHRGSELELTFSGERLQDAEEIICYEPGLEVRELKLVTNKLVKAAIRISPECGLGEHHLRLRTAGGISELRTFFVTALPVVAEKEP